MQRVPQGATLLAPLPFGVQSVAAINLCHQRGVPVSDSASPRSLETDGGSPASPAASGLLAPAAAHGPAAARHDNRLDQP